MCMKFFYFPIKLLKWIYDKGERAKKAWFWHVASHIWTSVLKHLEEKMILDEKRK